MGDEEKTTIKDMGPLEKCTIEHFQNLKHREYAIKHELIKKNYLCLSLNYKIDLINDRKKK